jgi:chloramphenicol O-acetyltransferase type A
MTKPPVFNIIDIEKWPRKSYFEHYSQKVKCTYSITANIDIESLLATCKKKLIKLYPAMIHIITTAVNQIDELRISYNNKTQLGIWDFMSPCYTLFHNENKTFSNIWTEYDKDFSIFNSNYIKDLEKYSDIKDFFPKVPEPSNTFPISCIPWVDFTGFNLNIYNDAQYLSPIFTIGKYTKQEKKILIPVSAQLHHAICDGYHAGLLFELIKKLALSSEEWINL